MKLKWIMSILLITSNRGIAQIFPFSNLLHYFNKSFNAVNYESEAPNNYESPVTMLPNPNISFNASLPNATSTLLLQTTKTTILSNFSNSPLNITSESVITSWNDSSNFKTEENILITSSSNDKPVTLAEPWTRSYKDVFTYDLNFMPMEKSYHDPKKIRSRYDQVAYVYPPHPFPHTHHPHPPPAHQSHLPPPSPHPPPVVHPSHPPQAGHYVFMKPYESSAEMHKLDLNPLVPPSNEVTIDYYVTSSSPTYFEEPEINYYPPGIKHVSPIDSEILHTKKHFPKNVPRPGVHASRLLPQSQVQYLQHPYPFYSNQVYLKPTPSYLPVKKFIATVRPIYASTFPPPNPHTMHVIKYTTPTNSRYRILPTYDSINSHQQIVDNNPLTLVSPTKSTPPNQVNDLLLPPRIPPMYYHNLVSTLAPFTLADLKHNRNVLKQFNKMVNKNNKEKRKKKKGKKNEADDDEEEDEKDSKEDYENYEYEETDKDGDEKEKMEAEDLLRKRKLKKGDRYKNNKHEESRLENYRTRPYAKLKAKNKKNIKEPYRFSDEAYDKFLRENYPSIPKNHKPEQMDYGSWGKRGVSSESIDSTTLFDKYKTQGSNRVDVKHKIQELETNDQQQTKSLVQNSDGQRVEFQMHGQGGPESYKFGYDTGAGYNRQFRYEEKDGEGHVKGHYGYYDDNGKLQVFNYAAHPEHGFQSEQTNANYDENGEQQ